MYGRMARSALVAVTLLACIAGASALVSTPRLRENAWHPVAQSNGLSAKSEPERVAGYFRLDRTYAGECLHSDVFVGML